VELVELAYLLSEPAPLALPSLLAQSGQRWPEHAHESRRVSIGSFGPIVVGRARVAVAIGRPIGSPGRSSSRLLLLLLLVVPPLPLWLAGCVVLAAVLRPARATPTENKAPRLDGRAQYRHFFTGVLPPPAPKRNAPRECGILARKSSR
jgi:hypothetical protein